MRIASFCIFLPCKSPAPCCQTSTGPRSAITCELVADEQARVLIAPSMADCFSTTTGEETAGVVMPAWRSGTGTPTLRSQILRGELHDSKMPASDEDYDRLPQKRMRPRPSECSLPSQGLRRPRRA